MSLSQATKFKLRDILVYTAHTEQKIEKLR